MMFCEKCQREFRNHHEHAEFAFSGVEPQKTGAPPMDLTFKYDDKFIDWCLAQCPICDDDQKLQTVRQNASPEWPMPPP
jgi:hypothetical protein